MSHAAAHDLVTIAPTIAIDHYSPSPRHAPNRPCPIKDEAHALELANDSKYGLGAGVWTRDVKRAHRIGRDICAGVFWVNTHHRSDPSAPWGGFKDSGIGRENGIDALNEYTSAKKMVVRMAEAKEVRVSSGNGKWDVYSGGMDGHSHARGDGDGDPRHPAANDRRPPSCRTGSGTSPAATAKRRRSVAGRIATD